LITLQKKVDHESIKNVRWYRKEAVEAIPIPLLGPDLIDLRKIDLIKRQTQAMAAAEDAAKAAAEDAARNALITGEGAPSVPTSSK
jgi:hypothetical protein